MRIRKTQMDAFGAAGENDFRDRLRKMLEQDYPEDVEELGERLDRVIDLGLEHARAYGISREKDIGLYFDVMFSLAYNFDTNPEYPWAAQILKRPDLEGPAKVERVAKLAQEAMEHEAEGATDDEQ
ncbi:MAG TPA: hypothetical protein VKU01_23170 [Bryobacteraceae bacterium]|nr:hypothetical protein [Bryobacteraceae bacterium]